MISFEKMERIQLSGCPIIENGKILLLWKNKQQHYEIPGGKVEEGESIEEAAIRETKEEIGCDVNIIKYAGYIDFEINQKEYRSHNFLANIKKEQVPEVMEKDVFSHFFWMPINEYEKHSVAPNVKEFCKKWVDS